MQEIVDNSYLSQSSPLPQSGRFPPIDRDRFPFTRLARPSQTFPRFINRTTTLRFQDVIQVLLVLAIERAFRTTVPRIGRSQITFIIFRVLVTRHRRFLLLSPVDFVVRRRVSRLEVHPVHQVGQI